MRGLGVPPNDHSPLYSRNRGANSQEPARRHTSPRKGRRGRKGTQSRGFVKYCIRVKDAPTVLKLFFAFQTTIEVTRYGKLIFK